MSGRVMIVTGGSSGIGLEVAKNLCEGGNDVIITCKTQDKGMNAIRMIKSVHPNSLVNWMQLDLSSSESVRNFAKEFTTKKKKLNVLVNCAGMALDFKDQKRKTNPEGNEITMATNYFGHFLLTHLLLDYMIATSDIMGDGRIVNVTCGIHDHENNWEARGAGPLDLKNFQLQKEGTFNGLQAYKNSKLCNVVMTYVLAHKLNNTSVVCNAVDPGKVPDTGLDRSQNKASRLFKGWFLNKCTPSCTHMTTSPRKAALQICDVADSSKYQGRNGKYFKDGVDDRSSIESYDPDLQRKVWKMTSSLLEINSVLEDEFDDVSLG